MADWTWVLGGAAPSGLEERELTQASGRVVTWRVDAPCTAQFSIDATSDEAAEISDLATDLSIYRDGVKLFRGRIGPTSDDLGTDDHRAQFTAADYRGMLNTRFVGADHGVYTNTDQGVIAFDLIDTTQARAGGNWGITDGIGATSGMLRDRTYDLGKPVGEAVAELGRVDGGFEWEIDADLALNRWYPQRGTVTGMILDKGGIISTAHRELNPSDFANAGIVTGASGLTPVMFETAGIASDPRGRWERSFAFPSITEQTTLDERAAWLEQQASTLRPEWRVTFTAGRWEGSSMFWIGDTATLVASSGRTAVHDPHRAVELMVVLGDNGSETVTCGMVPA